MQSTHTKKCSILGCGWLGLPLAQHLVQEGFIVNGSTTRKEKMKFLEEQGITPFQIHLHPDRLEGEIQTFLDGSILVLNFPPGRNYRDVAQDFPATFVHLLKEIKKSTIRHTIFVSSTGVYGTYHAGEVTEATPPHPDRASASALLEVEAMIQASGISSTILRFAGLVGYNRKPGRFLAGKQNLGQAKAPVNLVHQDDCIRVITEVIKQDSWGEIYNVCADLHPTRKDFYTYAAQHQGLEAPQFNEDKGSTQAGKSVSNKKVKSALQFTFSYPDPFNMVE